jgi:PAS domain S-box-containing protein
MSTLERLLLDRIPEMLLLVAPTDLRIVYANRTAVEQLGYADKELIGKSITDVESALSDVFYWQDVAGGQLSDIEAQEGLCLCADGSLLPIRKSIRVIRNDGDPMLLVVAKDIRHERQVDDDLAQALSQLRATLESTGNGILVLDLQGRVASMNRLFSQMWKIPDELLVQEDSQVLDFISDCVVDRAAIRNRLQAIADVGETSDVFELHDGRVFECRSRPQYLGERNNGRVFGFSDITDRIRIEQQLKTTASTAESASRAKTDFLAMMSHEIRTPINGVMGMVALMLDTPLDDEQRRYLDSINSCSEALLSIINDILDFSKIEMRKLTLECIDFNLLSLLEDVSDLYGLRAAEKDIEYTMRMAADVPVALRGDPGRVRQILTNLIGNAIKFTPSGTIALRVGCEALSGNRVRLHFALSDTGIGIPGDRLDRIFLRFEQADTSTTRKYGGTGLGLAITKQLVELMGGEISVTSEEGRGSTFDLSIVVEQVTQQAPTPPVPGLERLRELKGTHILVVDDNVTGRDNLVDLLLQWGFAVDGEGDAESALARVAAECRRGSPYRCVMIDMGLPGADGETLGKAIRRDAANAGSAVIILTSAGYRGDARRFEEAGFAAYLCKPIRRALLLDCLLTVLLESPRTVSASIVTSHSLAEGGRRMARLLVVEDHAVNLMVMQGVLRKLGYDRIETAKDGIEAVAVASKGQFDLILMDCQMPGMDGYEATRSLRAAGLRTPVIALTAHAMTGDREKCLEAGMDDYLTKPVRVDKLSQTLDKWLTSPGSLGIDEVKPPPRAPAISATDGFKYDQLLNLTMGDKELAKTVLGMFVDGIPNDVARLKAAIVQADAKQIRATAHFIKGAAANIFANDIRAIAAEIERAGSEGDIGAAGALMATLEARLVDFLNNSRVVEIVGART